VKPTRQVVVPKKFITLALAVSIVVAYAPRMAVAQATHCPTCYEVDIVNGCFKCSTGSTSPTYCNCQPGGGSCPQMTVLCGNCTPPSEGVQLNCSDCCPGCAKCVNIVGPKTTAWAKDASIPDEIRPFSATMALAIAELQRDTPACKTRRPIIDVLDQDTHTRIIKYEVYINDGGGVEIEGNGEFFAAGAQNWKLMMNNAAIASGDVYESK
jgi:hypothetical protein